MSSEKKLAFVLHMFPRSLVRSKASKNKAKAAFNRSHNRRRVMDIPNSPSSCDLGTCSCAHIGTIVIDLRLV